MSEATPKKKHTALKIVIGVIAVLILLIAILLSCALETTAVERVKRVPSTQDQIAIATMTGKFFTSVQKSYSNREETSTLVLTENELNALFTTAIRAMDQKRKPNDPIVFLKWNAGKLYADISLRTMGCYANIRTILVPEIANSQVKIKVESCKLGSLGVSTSTVEKVLDRELQKRTADPKAQIVLKAIRSLKVTGDGSLEIVIDIKAAPELVVLLS